MPWLEVHLGINAEQCAAVEEALEEEGALAITLGDAEDHPLLEPPPGEMPLWPNIELSALFDLEHPRDSIVASLLRCLPDIAPGQIRFRDVADQDWTRAWMDRFAPMRFGQRLWIVPSTHVPPEPEAVNVRLDPGLAFGTGTHPTTALCLQWLDQQDLSGKPVIDYGCGSGVLAIAALCLGAERAIGIDIDPQALLASADNAARNGVADSLQLYLPSDMPAPLRAPVLLANILAAPLVTLAPRLLELLEPGGCFALSGILAGQETEVIAAWEAAGARNIRTEREQDWVRLEGIKSGE